MKHLNFFLVLAFFITGISISKNVRSQGCSISVGHQYPTGTFSAGSVGTWNTVSTEMNGGNWTIFNVTPYSTYEWTYCSTYGGSENFDAELTLYNYTGGSTGAEEAYSNNSGLSNCPNAPVITWTCPAGITKVQLLTTQSGCLANTGASYNSTLVWEEESACQTPNMPTSASASTNTYCGGQTAPVTLFANGTLSSGAQWVWYAGGCGSGQSVGTGDNPDVIPTTTTTYFVREESSCGNSGCANTTINYIQQPLAPNPTATPNPVCSGQSFTVCANATGSPYYWTYNSSYLTNTQCVTENSATYGSGSYCVNYTSNGCQSAQGCVTVTVAQPPMVSINPGGNVYLCSAGANSSTQITASGATTYQWAPGSESGSTITVSNLQSTEVYSVTGTDNNGCTATSSVNVNVTQTPTNISITPTSTAICADGTGAPLSVNGTAQTYSWSPSTGLSSTVGQSITANPSAPTTYTVTASNNGSNVSCSVTASVSVTVNPLPAVAISPANPSITSGTSTTLTASGGTSYLWSNGQTTVAITVSPVAEATYTVTVTDGNGCSAIAEATVSVTTGISDMGTLSQFQIEPNPSNGQFILSFEPNQPELITLKIWDATGREIQSERLGTITGRISKAIDLSDVSIGAYLVQLTIGGETMTKKIIIK